MHMTRCASALIAGMFMACSATAEDRFYQVIDATGHVQVIREASPQRPAKNTAAQSRSAALDAPPTSKAAASAPDAVIAVGPEQMQSPPVEAPYAAYNGEEFVDSEALDSAHEKPGKDKFYVMNDPAGTRIQSMSDGEGMAISSAHGELSTREYIALKDGSVVMTGPMLLHDEKGCFTEKQMRQGEELLAGHADDVIFDRKLPRFLPPNGLVQLYRVTGEGFGSLKVRSYARKDVDPDFVVPRLGFADSQGCITRVTDFYFQRYYSATKSKHPMLEADLVLHANEAYLFLLTPSGPVHEDQARPEYRLGSLGRVSVKWQP